MLTQYKLHPSQSNFTENVQDMLAEIIIQNLSFKNYYASPRGQWVKYTITKNKHCNHNKTLPILCTSLNIYSTHIQENCLWMLLVWCFERLKVTHNILIFLWSGTFQLLALLNINWFCWCMPQFLLAFCVLWVVSGVLWWIIGNYSHCWAVFGQDFCPSCGIPTHESWNKMAAILQTTLSNTFSWKKMCLFWRKFHWSLFPRV